MADDVVPLVDQERVRRGVGTGRELERRRRRVVGGPHVEPRPHDERLELVVDLQRGRVASPPEIEPRFGPARRVPVVRRVRPGRLAEVLHTEPARVRRPAPYVVGTFTLDSASYGVLDTSTLTSI